MLIKYSLLLEVVRGDINVVSWQRLKEVKWCWHEELGSREDELEGDLEVEAVQCGSLRW